MLLNGRFFEHCFHYVSSGVHTLFDDGQKPVQVGWILEHGDCGCGGDRSSRELLRDSVQGDVFGGNEFQHVNTLPFCRAGPGCRLLGLDASRLEPELTLNFRFDFFPPPC